MKPSEVLLLAAQALSVLALPAPSKAGETAAAPKASTTTTAAAAATTTATAEAGTGGEAGEAKNEIEQAGQFGQIIQLGGGNIKTDIQFPPGVGSTSSSPI